MSRFISPRELQCSSQLTPDISVNKCDYSIHGVSREGHVRAVYGIIASLGGERSAVLFGLVSLYGQESYSSIGSSIQSGQYDYCDPLSQIDFSLLQNPVPAAGD